MENNLLFDIFKLTKEYDVSIKFAECKLATGYQVTVTTWARWNKPCSTSCRFTEEMIKAENGAFFYGRLLDMIREVKADAKYVFEEGLGDGTGV